MCLFSWFFFFPTQFNSFIDLLFLRKICLALWAWVCNLIQQTLPLCYPCSLWSQNSRVALTNLFKSHSSAFIGGDWGLWNFLFTATQLTSSSRQNELRKYNKTLDLPVKDPSSVRTDSMVHSRGSKHLKCTIHTVYQDSGHPFLQHDWWEGFC